MNGWIRVKDKLPRKNKIVIFKKKNCKTIFVGAYGDYGWGQFVAKFPAYLKTVLIDVTHWMPLPERPNE